MVWFIVVFKYVNRDDCQQMIVSMFFIFWITLNYLHLTNPPELHLHLFLLNITNYRSYD